MILYCCLGFRLRDDLPALTADDAIICSGGPTINSPRLTLVGGGGGLLVMSCYKSRCKCYDYITCMSSLNEVYHLM